MGVQLSADLKLLKMVNLKEVDRLVKLVLKNQLNSKKKRLTANGSPISDDSAFFSHLAYQLLRLFYDIDMSL